MTQEEIIGILQEFLPDIPPDDLNDLAVICNYQSFADKEIILKSGNRLKRVFLILEGVARGFILSEDGEEKTTLLRGKGIFVADAEAIFTDAPQKLTISAIGKTRVLIFSFDSFEQLARENENIMTLLVNAMKESILRLTYRLQSMITLTAEERYRDLMRKNPIFLKDTYDKYIANYLGITPVSLSRIKKKLKPILN